MLLFKRPTAEQIAAFLAAQRSQTFSYPEVGATRGKLPTGYFVDRTRTQLGRGEVTYLAACAALRRWEIFRIGWVELSPPEAPLAAGTEVAIVAGRCGLWTLNACRVVYTLDEPDPPRHFGFAYGTLPDHLERGEERFLVEWNDEDDSVWFDVTAFSWPNHFIAQCGLPMIRRMQKRFGRDSGRAMQLAAAQTFAGVAP